MPACKLTWYQGTHKPQIWKDNGIPQYDSGVLFVGTNGRMLLSDYNKHVLLPEAEFKDFKRPEPFIRRRPASSRNGCWPARTARRPAARSIAMPAC